MHSLRFSSNSAAHEWYLLSPVRLLVRIFDHLLNPAGFVPLVGFHRPFQIHSHFSFYLPGSHDRSFLRSGVQSRREHTFAVNRWLYTDSLSSLGLRDSLLLSAVTCVLRVFSSDKKKRGLWILKSDKLFFRNCSMFSTILCCNPLVVWFLLFL